MKVYGVSHGGSGREREKRDTRTEGKTKKVGKVPSTRATGNTVLLAQMQEGASPLHEVFMGNPALRMRSVENIVQALGIFSLPPRRSDK